jgi:hypothetical protein
MSFKLSGIPAGIRSGYFTITSIGPNRYTKLLNRVPRASGKMCIYICCSVMDIKGNESKCTDEMQFYRLNLLIIVTTIRAGQAGFNSQQGQGFLSSSPYPERLWASPGLLSNGYGVSFPGMKQSRRVTDHSPTSSSAVKNAWSHTSTAHTSSRSGA